MQRANPLGGTWRPGTRVVELAVRTNHALFLFVLKELNAHLLRDHSRSMELRAMVPMKRRIDSQIGVDGVKTHR